MESGYVSREVSPYGQFTVPGPINIDRSVETGTTSNQSPESSEVIPRSPDPPVINFHEHFVVVIIINTKTLTQHSLVPDHPCVHV